MDEIKQRVESPDLRSNYYMETEAKPISTEAEGEGGQSSQAQTRQRIKASSDMVVS